MAVVAAVGEARYDEGMHGKEPLKCCLFAGYTLEVAFLAYHQKWGHGVGVNQSNDCVSGG